MKPDQHHRGHLSMSLRGISPCSSFNLDVKDSQPLLKDTLRFTATRKPLEEGVLGCAILLRDVGRVLLLLVLRLILVLRRRRLRFGLSLALSHGLRRGFGLGRSLSLRLGFRRGLSLGFRLRCARNASLRCEQTLSVWVDRLMDTWQNTLRICRSNKVGNGFSSMGLSNGVAFLSLLLLYRFDVLFVISAMVPGSR